MPVRWSRRFKKNSAYPNNEHSLSACLGKRPEEVMDTIIIGLFIGSTWVTEWAGMSAYFRSHFSGFTHQVVLSGRPRAFPIGVAVVMVSKQRPESGLKGHVTMNPISSGASNCVLNGILEYVVGGKAPSIQRTKGKQSLALWKPIGVNPGKPREGVSAFEII